MKKIAEFSKNLTEYSKLSCGINQDQHICLKLKQMKKLLHIAILFILSGSVHAQTMSWITQLNEEENFVAIPTSEDTVNDDYQQENKSPVLKEEEEENVM